DANLHHNIPHQSTDAAVTYIGQQIDLHFDFSGKKAKIELGNEPWNPAVGFSDAWTWFWYGSQSAQEGTFDPTTATCTSAAHGLTTGDEIACFNNIYHKDWPYAYGTTVFVIVDDVNTFRCAVTEAAALRGADVLDDTDVDHNVYYIPDESATFLRFKPAIAGGIYSQGGYYAERSMQVWDLIAAEIDEENMEVVAGCWAGDVNFMLQQLEVPGYRERVMKSGQFYIAPYWKSIGIADDFENYTNEQHADYAIDVFMADGGDWHNYFISHIEALGCYNFSTYECGNHNGNNGAISQEKVDKLISLARDTTHGTRITDHYFRRMSELGIKVATNFTAHQYYNSAGSTGETFGSMEHQGDTDAAQYLGIKPFLDSGGVPK
ncbi:MAG: hypothetical protein GY814_05155, partial [Gammaproteobacteria bacterium]|nr:hypothetical protein [Gammaproteobacteria bacterium]